MNTAGLILGETYDVAIFGGGLCGYAAAWTCARAGFSTLLVERRPALGWEATWACQLDYTGGGGQVAQAIADAMTEAGGLRNNRLDAPILEMVLDREAANVGMTLLYYAQPIDLEIAENEARTVFIGSKSGQQVVRAKAYVDATERGLLWRRSGISIGNEGCAGRSALFLHGTKTLDNIIDLGSVGQTTNITLQSTPWPDESVIYYDMPTIEPADAIRAMPCVLQLAHSSGLLTEDTIVTHTSVEPYPLTQHHNKVAVQHPHIPNLFNAGLWAGDASEEDSIFAIHMAHGEAAGQAICSALTEIPMPQPATVPMQTVEAPTVQTSQVLVCGGGTAGAVAAIASARQGAQTTVLEAGSFLGGIGAGGGIHTYYHGISGGLQDEVDQRVHALTALFGGTRHVRGFHPIVKRIVLQQMADEAGVTTIYHKTGVGHGSVQKGLTQEWSRVWGKPFFCGTRREVNVFKEIVKEVTRVRTK
ncbi:MAG: FAD-dependent oxidoreductase, partial [Chloroflexota bacterium]